MAENAGREWRWEGPPTGRECLIVANPDLGKGTGVARRDECLGGKKLGVKADLIV